ncbi:hypothetical protein NM688_g864 [Phlebia brevispora]|uniref:Uncharacterized protein n=1 Tax=Phlebia brevispora TaxID=194682 RepID=A0ACC1TDC7_9APHY|nr:hypothetical protein NM688_g864 [Phlebia brevispora]
MLLRTAAVFRSLRPATRRFTHYSHHRPTAMAPPGYLLVYSDPGEKVSEDGFNDWYDNEHVPLRVEVPAFLSWHRWIADDNKTPKYAATYDLTSFEATQKPPYTTLAGTRSEREKRLIRDVDVLDRRTYELWGGLLPEPSSFYDPAKPAPYTVFVAVNVKPGTEDAYNKWYDEEHIPLLSKVPGWIRSRRFVLKDWGQAGVQGEAGQKEPPKFLAGARVGVDGGKEEQRARARDEHAVEGSDRQGLHRVRFEDFQALQNLGEKRVIEHGGRVFSTPNL